jgi:hypothetical protein
MWTFRFLIKYNSCLLSIIKINIWLLFLSYSFRKCWRLLFWFSRTAQLKKLNVSFPCKDLPLNVSKCLYCISRNPDLYLNVYLSMTRAVSDKCLPEPRASSSFLSVDYQSCISIFTFRWPELYLYFYLATTKCLTFHLSMPRAASLIFTCRSTECSGVLSAIDHKSCICIFSCLWRNLYLHLTCLLKRAVSVVLPVY